METVSIVVNQTLVMFLLIGVGYILFKSGKISQNGSKDMASMLVTVVIPAVIINSFSTNYTQEKAQALLLCTALASVVLIISLVISHILFKKDAIGDFASAFSNPGFFGIPLVQAALGNDAVLYITPFIVGINILQFTYGVGLMSNKKGSIEWKKFAKNPIFLSTIVGIFFFLLPVNLPSIITKPLNNLANLNAPLAMMVMGVYLAQTDLKSLFCSIQLDIISFSRLILIPIVVLATLYLIPASNEIRTALLIAGACPVGANVAVYAQLNHKDYAYAVKTVVLSTLLCIISLPLTLALAQILWQ